MGTEVFMRNPDNYVRECMEVGVLDFVWDFGVLHKKSIDAKRFHELYMPGLPYRAWVMGDQGAYLFDTESSPEKPRSRAQVWEYGQALPTLEAMMLLKRDDDEDHRIFISRLPSAKSYAGKAFLHTLLEMQEDYPDAILHLHGLYGYPAMFGMGFKAVDCDPRTPAQKGKIVLPNGKDIPIEYAPESKMWVDLLEFKLHELRVPRNRCMYNIKSALWAGKHYREAIKIKTRGIPHNPDPDDPRPKPPETNRIMNKNKKPQEGDLFLCDVCSLQNHCRYFRAGAVCIVPDSEPVELATLFNSRDAQVIMQGLSNLLAAQSRRLTKALEHEQNKFDIKGELDPEVTKIINTLFDRGAKLAKLRDPSLAGPKLQITTSGPTQINSGQAHTPQALMSAIVGQFIERGIAVEDITPEMITAMLEQQAHTPQAIETTAEERSA